MFSIHLLIGGGDEFNDQILRMTGGHGFVYKRYETGCGNMCAIYALGGRSQAHRIELQYGGDFCSYIQRPKGDLNPHDKIIKCDIALSFHRQVLLCSFGRKPHPLNKNRNIQWFLFHR